MSAPLNAYRTALLKFETRMVNKYGTRRFALRYLQSEQTQHNILRRALRNALWLSNNFDPKSVVVAPELNTAGEEEVKPVLQKRRNAPVPRVTFVAPVPMPDSKEYITGVTAADLLRSFQN